MTFCEWQQTEHGQNIVIGILHAMSLTHEDVIAWILVDKRPHTNGLSFLIERYIPKEHWREAKKTMPERVEAARLYLRDEYHNLIGRIADMDNPSCPACGALIGVRWLNDKGNLAVVCYQCNKILIGAWED